MLIETSNGIMYGIHFKNCTIYTNSISGAFLSHDKNFLSIERKTNRVLANKFKICTWDEINENLSHIKFLIKYSPVFSKLVDLTEFDKIEFCDPKFGSTKFYICCNICNPEFRLARYHTYYNERRYFSIFYTNYENFTIKYDSKFDNYVKLINKEV